MLIQIRKLLPATDGSAGFTRGQHLYLQELPDDSNLFGQLVSAANEAEAGNDVELVLDYKGRLFAFPAKALNVKTFVSIANKTKARKVTPAAASTEASVTAAAAPAPTA